MHRCPCRLDLPAAGLLRLLGNVQRALVNLVARHHAEVPGQHLAMMVQSLKLIPTLIRTFVNWVVTNTFCAAATARQRGVLVLRYATRLLVDLHLVEVD